MTVGIGWNTEVGAGLQDIGFTPEHEETALLAAKHVDTLSRLLRLSVCYGANIRIPIASGTESGLFAYASLAGSPSDRSRLTFGVFRGSGGISDGTSVGILYGAEYQITDWLQLAADGLTGSSTIGYTSLGAIFTIYDNIYLFAAYQRSNTARNADSYLTGFTYAF